MRSAATGRMLLLSGVVALGSAVLHAQGPGGHGGPGGPGMGMPSGGGRMGGGRMGGGMGLPRVDRGGGDRGGDRGMGSHGTTQSSGRWWDDKTTAKSLGLNGQQQKRMDTVFAQNRDVLQQRYDAFVKAQTKLDALKRSNSASEGELFAEIQHASQARAELEQAYTHMQLQIRGELTPEQAAKLDESH